MYPQQFQDILDFIDQNPQYLHDLRVRLLSPELITLPEQFAQLVKVVQELAANFNDFAIETNRRLTTLETDVATLKTDVAALKGSDTERRARQNILNIAKDHLQLTRGRIRLATDRDPDPDFLASIHAAENQGLITDTQVDNVLVSDIIIQARRTDDKQYVHAAFEVSRTISLRDIQRAHNSAATVAAATGEHTIAAVIGELIHPAQQAQADRLNVHVLIPAMFGQQEYVPDDDPDTAL